MCLDFMSFRDLQRNRRVNWNVYHLLNTHTEFTIKPIKTLGRTCTGKDTESNIMSIQ